MPVAFVAVDWKQPPFIFISKIAYQGEIHEITQSDTFVGFISYKSEYSYHTACVYAVNLHDLL